MRNDLSDVAGLGVGHHDRRDGGYLTGTTVVLPPPHGAVGGVDVRGGAPGTRETDLLDPTAVPGGATVAALTVVNAAGSAVDPRTGDLWGERLLRPEDLDHPPGRVDVQRWGERQALRPHPVRNTTLAVLATDATLTKAQCRKLAGCGQDGLARAINPIHTAVDGDTVFGLSTSVRGAPDDQEWFALLAAAADVVTRALVRGLVAARTVSTAAGTWPGWLDLVVPPT